MDGASALSLTRSSRVNDLSSWVLLLCGLKTSFLFVFADNSARPWSVNSTYINTTAAPLDITDICPGVEYLMKQNNTILQVNVSDCENNLPEHTAHQGVVYGVCDHFTTFCKMHVEGPQGMQVAAHVQRLAYWCDSRHWRIKMSELSRYSPYILQCDYHTLSEMVISSLTNKMHMLHTNIPLTKVSVVAFTHPSFFVKHIQEYSGYVLIAPRIYKAFVQKWEISSRHAVMVSIHHLTTRRVLGECGHITLAYSKQNATYQTLEKVYIWRPTLAKIIFTSYLKIVCRSRECCGKGLKMYVSVLSTNIQNLMLPSELFNCSVNYYSKLKHHLDCNLQTECEDGRDETERCSFSNSDCRGLVASRNKCFTLVVHDSGVIYTILKYDCMKVNGKLASVKSRKEQEDFLHVVKNYSGFRVAIGLTSGWHSVPFMYSMFHKWFDNTFVYNMNHFRAAGLNENPRRFDIVYIRSMVLKNSLIHEFKSVLCEIELQSNGVNHFLVPLAYLHSPTPSFTYTKQLLLVCPDSHVTHVFLPCNSGCTTAMHLTSCTATNVSDARLTDMFILQRRFTHTYVVFKCEDGILTVHHTFVCDFRPDCPDGTDESFCEHPSCTGLLCSNGQCVSFSQWLNRYSDCVDDSDETLDWFRTSWVPIKEVKQQRFYVNLDGAGYFTQQAMTADASCPRSHYQCSAEWLYCLPIYTRCNGFFDCVYGEDEQDCETMSCAGFYQCRESRVCVHRDHLCDGWGQCPQRDDELMCDMTCPEGCLCQGHAFLCNKLFPSDLFPQLRYMDSTGTHMSLADFNNNTYLVHLTLSQCSLYNISSTKLLNLRYINLTNNYLGTLVMAVFIELPNLRTIHLENNPLNNIKRAKTKPIHYALSRVDVSKTHVGILYSELSIYFPCLKYLNISFCDVEAIGPIGFKNMPQLRELDISGNTVIIFPFDLLSSLYHLQRISSSNYRLCCRSLFPKRSGEINCFAPNTVLPSCTELMPTELYRVFFWLTGICSLTGNLVCFITSLAVNKVFGSHFLIYIFNMQLANICMGIHTIIVLAADYIFHGQYIQTEKAWTNSVACKLAGFLSLLSSIVSVLIIWFITVHHVIALYFPLNVRRLNRCLTSTVCAVMWVVGILLASVPFLPGLSHWGLQGQSGLCRLALFDSYNSRLDFRWFTVIVAVNFILCLMIVAGQTIIYRRTPKHRITLHPSKRPLYSSVHVMETVSVTDAVCWFAFGLVTMMNSHGVGGLDKLRDTMVVFVLPFSSALNPLLYMWAVRTQWQRQGQEERLLQALKSQLAQTGKIKTSMQ